MPSISNNILKLSKILLPTGRAFRAGEGSNMEKELRALAVSETQLYNDSVSTFNSMLPDNDYFTEEDATAWEVRLGMVTDPASPLADRKLAILRKMAAPGLNPAKGHYLFIEGQLQAAGFDVYVHENLFVTYPTGVVVNNNPADYYGTTNLKKPRHGMFRHGQIRHGAYWNNLVVNSITQEGDMGFNLGGSLASTFFIGGETLGTYANVLATRETEFRQLILTLKQVQAVGLLFINYV